MYINGTTYAVIVVLGQVSMVSDEARRARALQREERQRALEARQEALEVRLQAVAVDVEQAKRSADSGLIDRVNRLEAKLGGGGEASGDLHRMAEALKARVVAAEGELKRMRHVLAEVLTVYDDLQVYVLDPDQKEYFALDLGQAAHLNPL